MATFLNLVGTTTGLKVAETVGKGILTPEAISYQTAAAGLLPIVLWGALATYFGLPISISHGLIAGLAGAGIAMYGTKAVVWSVMQQILVAVVAAPAIGFIGGFLIMLSLYWLFRRSSPTKVQRTFGNLQILSSAFVAYTHGLNDGQKVLAVIIMPLAIYSRGLISFRNVPWWAIALAALSISFGTATGGWHVIKTLGMRVTMLRPVQGFAAETSAALVTEIASLLGIPISTTHSISASITGVGATRRLSAVRWGVAGHIVAAWILTFPLCGGLSYLTAILLKLIM